MAFSTPALLSAFDATSIDGFARVGCGVLNDEFQLIRSPSAALLAAVDGVTVLAAAAPAGAVWARAFCRNLPAQYATTWFIAIGGSDANAGTTVGAPLATFAELGRRLKGATLVASVTVTVGAGVFDNTLFDVTIPNGMALNIVGNVTSSATDTLAVSVGTTPGAAGTNVGAVRASITSTALSFTRGKRVRSTSGAASGSLNWITKVTTPGVGGVAKLGRWGQYANTTTDNDVVQTEPIATTTYVIDTLNTTIGQLDMRCRGGGRIVVKDCIVDAPVGEGHRCIGDSDSYIGVLLYGCSLEASWGEFSIVDSSYFTLACCSIGQNTSSFFGYIVGGDGLFFSSCVVFDVCLTIVGNAQVEQLYGMCFADGQIWALQGSWTAGDNFNGGLNDCQFVDSTWNTAVYVSPFGKVYSFGTAQKFWGLDNTLSSYAIQVLGLGGWAYEQKPSIPGSGVLNKDFLVGVTSGLYAAAPVGITTAAHFGASLATV